MHGINIMKFIPVFNWANIIKKYWKVEEYLHVFLNLVLGYVEDSF